MSYLLILHVTMSRYELYSMFIFIIAAGVFFFFGGEGVVDEMQRPQT